MAKQTKQEKPTITKAEKKDAVKALFRELLQVKSYKRTELIDETAALYTQRFPDKDTENVNDVKGRVGSVFDIMKKEGEIVLDGGMYALKTQKQESAPIEEPEKNPPKKVVKKKAEEKESAKRSMKRAAAKKGDKKEDSEPVLPILPIMPVNPNYPIDPIVPAVIPIPLEQPNKEKEDKEKATAKKRGRKPKTEAAENVQTTEVKAEEAILEEKPTPKKRGRKPKAEAVEEKVKTPVKEEEQTAKTAQETLAAVKEKAEEVKMQTAEETPAQNTQKAKNNLAPVFDMSLLLGGKKAEKKNQMPLPEKKEEKEQKQEKQPTVSAMKQENATKETEKTQEKTAVKAQAEKPLAVEKQKVVNEPKKVQTLERRPIVKVVRQSKTQTADEQLKERYLKRLRSLSGEYFEYYSVYLLERYSMKNGRRLESLRICGGERDGGIDGEIELTDRLGFRETIYIQAKNWNPEKGDEKLWVVGETLLQQFIGACVCRQTRDGKQHCRGIFMTTSRFTPEAKRLLEQMSEKIVGYDGNDLYEAAKECSFGLIQKNGEWTLDERLLSGEKAFFSLT